VHARRPVSCGVGHGRRMEAWFKGTRFLAPVAGYRATKGKAISHTPREGT
jgi:hypothetical protein